jgi:hypothetical protein
MNNKLSTTINKLKSASIPLQLGICGGQRNISYLFTTEDEAALRLFRIVVAHLKHDRVPNNHTC